MNRVVEFLVDMLPLDPPGRRAVDETLADWRHEAGEARTMAGRVAATTRGSAAVAVAVLSVTARDAFSLQTLRVVVLVVGAACLMAIGFRFRSFESLAVELAGHGLVDARIIGLWGSLLPQTVSLCIPLALLAPPVRRAASRSLLGACFLLIALSAANLGWITPLANQWFRQTTVDVLRQSGLLTPSGPGGHDRRPDATTTGSGPIRGLAEYTATDLVREVRSSGMRTRSALANLNGRGALLAMVPVCLILGAQARRLGAARRWRMGAGLLAWVTFSIGCLVVFITAIGASGLLGRQLSEELLTPFLVWFFPIVCSLTAVALACLAHQSEIRNSNARPIFI